MRWAARKMTMDNPIPMPADMMAQIPVRVLVPLWIGDRLLTIGEVVQVSRARASYLCFLQITEPA